MLPGNSIPGLLDLLKKLTSLPFLRLVRRTQPLLDLERLADNCCWWKSASHPAAVSMSFLPDQPAKFPDQVFMWPICPALPIVPGMLLRCTIRASFAFVFSHVASHIPESARVLRCLYFTPTVKRTRCYRRPC